MEKIFIGTDFDKVNFETGQHVEYTENGNEALKQLRKNFPNLKIELNKELLCPYFSRKNKEASLKGFHTHLSKLDLQEDKEMFAAAERAGRSVSVDAYLQLYPLPDFTPETAQALTKFAKCAQFQSVNVAAIGQDDKGNFSLDAEAIKQGLVERYSKLLTDPEVIKNYHHGQAVEATLEAFVKKIGGLSTGPYTRRTMDDYFTIDKEGRVRVRPEIFGGRSQLDILLNG